MRNLRNLKHTAIKIGNESAPLVATAWSSWDVICAFGPTKTSPAISLKRFSTTDGHLSEHAALIAAWDAPSPNPDLAIDRILSLYFLRERDVTCLVLEGGDIITVRGSNETAQIEIVGSVDDGIAAAKWSPDDSLLVIATKANTLLFMTDDFESFAQVKLSVEDLKISDHVSVGWGKTETQFKGRGAKALRDPTLPEHVDEGRLSTSDAAETTISWRGDGQYVAINSILETIPRRRVIRVYSVEGVLTSVSEPVDGLEGALSWRPDGQVIAGIQRRDGQVDVVFFERNGLRHGEFSLRLEPEDVDKISSALGLAWNTDSTALAVTMRDRVQLWTMGNYHYYLKQEIMMDMTTSGSVLCSWHTEKALTLSCSNGFELRALEYSFEIDRGSVMPPHDHGIVAVIDGRKLKITPFGIANIPPPLAFDELDLPANAIDVAVSQTGMKIAVLHTEGVTLWKCDYSTTPVTRARLEVNHSITDNKDMIHRQITYAGRLDAGEERIVVLSSQTDSEGSLMAWFSTLEQVQDAALPHGCKSLFRHINHDRMLYQDDRGSVRDPEHQGNSHFVSGLFSPPIAVDMWRNEDFVINFGLLSNGILLVHNPLEELRIPGCTSFLVTASHLIYTTSKHLLKFIHLRAGKLEVPPDEPERDERCRNVERGAKLVTVVPRAYTLVLQMPRGNLETIYPRALVLAGIRLAIDTRDYRTAFGICRTQRVDMNILHDHRPTQFMQDVELFVKQVRRVDYIDLFLSSLSEEDVCITIYRETLQVLPDEPANATSSSGGDRPIMPHATPAASKTNTICDAFLKVLAKQPNRHLQNIVSAHVSKSPPDLEAGLLLVSKLRQGGQQEQLEQAVDHICFLADVNRLYDAALGLYDLDVTLLVAQQSQKDPREYLPYLQGLSDMSPMRRRFAIDNDLKRYSKAMSHLHALDEFDELAQYATTHELYGSALELYRYDETRLRILMQLYADFLSSHNRYRDAGIAYEYISDYTAAHEAYRSATMWRECLACAGMMKMSESKLCDVAKGLADSLEESKDFAAAATIHWDYLQDLHAATRLLCRAYRFAEAIRLVAKGGQAEALPRLVDTGLVEASATMTEMLAEMKLQLNAQVPRLHELREKKAQDPMAFLDGGDTSADADIPDNISLASTDASTSGGTFMTRYTNRSTGTLATNATRKTSKNRRREERKRARGKKGTVYEEEYLVNSIARLVERLNAANEDVSRLMEGLMRRSMRERAIAVSSAFQDVVEACRNSMTAIFAPDAHETLHLASKMPDSGTPPRPWGGQGVLWDALSDSQQKREPPVLKAFQTLSLIER